MDGRGSGIAVTGGDEGFLLLEVNRVNLQLEFMVFAAVNSSIALLVLHS